MLRVNGLYGHVRRNDLRSLAMFAGFIVAFQALVAVVLLVPLILFDIRHSVFLPLGYAERYVPIVFVVGVSLFAVRFRRHVATVRATVDFVYVDRRTDPRLVNIVETAAITAGLPLPKVGLIESPARNAFACGLSASSAVVVVTRGLIEALDDDELAAVVAHEVAHIRNGDIRLMAAANVLMENLLLVQRKNLLRIRGWKGAVFAVLFTPFLFASLFAGLVSNFGLTLARVSRLLIASSREFVADAEAVRLTQNPEALMSALRRIEGRSTVAGLDPQADAMMIDGAVDGAYATHPTIAERIAALARHAGAFAGDTVPGRDTRVSAQGGAHPGLAGPWDRSSIAAPSEPKRRLIERVNAGTKENIFGLTPSVRRTIKIGFALLACLQIWSIFQYRTMEARLDAKFAGISSNLVRLGDKASRIDGRVDEADLGRQQRQEVARLSALPPVEARCFSTHWYQVGDRGLHRIVMPDPALIQAFADGRRNGSSDIVLERYLGLRLRTVQAVEQAGPANVGQAQVDYVKTRKTVIQVMHRFFGEPGLEAARQAYGGPQDRAIVAALSERRRVGATSLVGETALSPEIDLLIASPGDFIPCVARAASTPAGSRGDAGPFGMGVFRIRSAS